MSVDLKTSYLWARENLPYKSPAECLALARRDLSEGKTRYRVKVKGWNPASESGARFIESPEGAGLRLVGFCDEVVKNDGIRRHMDHQGWYCDAFQDETMRGVVFQLPSRKGAERYLIGYKGSWDCGYLVDCSRGSFYDNKLDAAFAADSFAQHAAEKERDYNEANSAGYKWASNQDFIADARRGALALLKERRELIRSHPGLQAPTICDATTGKIQDLLGEIRELRKECEDLAESIYGAANIAAFNEGAGRTVIA